MKVLVVALFVLLCTLTLRAEDENQEPSFCCFAYTSRKIPPKFVAFYYETSSTCSSKGIVFVTKRGRHVCARPNEAWVQEHIRDLEGSSKKH
ncbi:C-C motif chemokine 3 [Ictidomys tridecemlineatus]|uniref:C-C motif chemokine 3 n=1 Tax=Ictidomys tridecemlineatus TaxID=43179 RepID=UPI000682540A|nr:C-C motif chemokine 3 [Ictidomys tridecemlineatus]KAG3269465.1 C-C motif chemokine 3 [Ictidomys tridecemlineatus]